MQRLLTAADKEFAWQLSDKLTHVGDEEPWPCECEYCTGWSGDTFERMVYSSITVSMYSSSVCVANI
jgi:hypothetical protein